MFEPVATIAFILVLIISAFLAYRLQKGKNLEEEDSSGISAGEFEILE